MPTGPVLQYVDEKPDAPLTVVVYTGADGTFSLYEDDGRSYGYEKGAVQPHPAVVERGQGRTEIGAREGAFTGMQATRTIHVRWVSGPRADAGALEPATDATVQYDGKAVTVRKAAGK